MLVGLKIEMSLQSAFFFTFLFAILIINWVKWGEGTELLFIKVEISAVFLSFPPVCVVKEIPAF